MIKVLIVDDEYLVRFGLRTTIEWERFGCQIVGEASDGEEALELAVQVRPDLIITDISMPFLDGIAFMEQLRQYDSDVKIIVLSGYGEFNYAKGAIQFGASAYLLKPIENDKLTEVIAQLANDIRWEQEQRLLLKRKLIGDLVLQLKKLQIRKTPLHSKLVEEAKLYIKRQYVDDLNITAIADRLFVSPSYLMHAFKDHTGITVKDFITSVRIEQAKRLLRSGNYKIYEVGDKVGYPDSRYFAQLFKKHTNLTPREYIKSTLYDS